MRTIIKKTLHFMVTLIAFLAITTGTSLAAEGINWDDSTISATGMGVAPPNARNAAQARMLARRAAVVDAYRQLAESVNGVNVDSETTVENMMVMNDSIKTKVSAVIKGARVISEQITPDGGYEVTMQISLFGVSNSLASAIMPAPATKESFPAPIPNVTASIPSGSSAAEAPNGKPIGGYTGLVVDCRGLGLSPVMSPVIKNESGSPIYGYKNLDIDKVISQGMAAYTYDITNAPRAGTNPLVVKAVRVDNHNANPVLSLADANRVLIENGATGFLDRTNVVFVR